MGWLLGGAVFTASFTAAAGNVQIDDSGIVIHDSSPPLPGGDGKWHGINRQDCLQGDWAIDIPVTVQTGIGTLQLWVSESANCAADIARVNGECTMSPFTVPAQGIYRLTALEIVSAMGIGDCESPSSDTGPRTVTAYFLLAGSVETTAGLIDADNVATLPIRVDLSPPAPPSAVQLDPGDGHLALTIPSPNDGDTVGYYVFMNPLPPAKQANGEGTCIEGGAGAPDAGVADEQCAPGAVVPCVDPVHPSYDALSRYDVRIDAPGLSVPLDGLTNGQAYTVAIAAIDAADNIGPLSVVHCATPEGTSPATPGGTGGAKPEVIGGCGSCAVGGGEGRTLPGAAALLAGVLGIALRRRRASARSRRRI